MLNKSGAPSGAEQNADATKSVPSPGDSRFNTTLSQDSRPGLSLWRPSGLGNWLDPARAQGDRKTEKEKLEQALAIFTELKMPRERDAVQAELESRG